MLIHESRFNKCNAGKIEIVKKETPTAVAGVTLRLNSLVVKSLSLVSGCNNTDNIYLAKYYCIIGQKCRIVSIVLQYADDRQQL